MSKYSSQEIELLREAYVAFNSRDLDSAFATMAEDVKWPRAFKGDFVRGHQEIREYWTEQWAEIDPRVEPLAFFPREAGIYLVTVHQVVRDLNGTVLVDEHVGHRFTVKNGLIEAMEVCPVQPAISQSSQN